MILVFLGLVLLGVLIGGAGMKRLGRLARGVWRPGAGMLAVLAFGTGLLLLLRGAFPEGAALLVATPLLAFLTRHRAVRAAGPSVGMGRREAASILGVETDADAAQIEEAYRRLIRRAHPDHGGSPGLAAQLNAARSALAQSPMKRGRTAGRGAEV